MKKQLFFLALLLLLSIPSILPLLSPGFFPIHDDTQVARVYEMKEALVDGAFPVRWVENLGYGYGYPIFNFYAPLAYYIGAFFNSIGFDSLTATKIMFGLGMIVSGPSMYFLAKEFWGKTGGLLSAVLYVYAPYHALNIYVRGAIGEFWAYALIPLVILGIYKIYLSTAASNIKKKGKPESSSSAAWLWIALTAIAYASLILSHNLTAFMVTPFIVLFGLAVWIYAFRRKRLRYAIPASFILAVMLSAFYWLPAVFEMRYTNVMSVVGGGSDYKDHYVCIPQLWDSPWLFGGSAPGCSDGMSYKIGKLHIVLSILSLLPFILRRNDKKVAGGLLFGYVGVLVSLFLMLEYSKPLWDLVQQMSFIQFPWRYLSLVSFFLSLVGGATVLLLSGKLRFIAGLLLCFAVIAVNRDVFTPSKIIPRTNADYIEKSVIQWETTKMSDEYLPQGFQKPETKNDIPKEKIAVDKNTVSIANVIANSQSLTADIKAKEKAILHLNMAYFPAWKMYINGKEVSYKNTSTGMQIAVPQGESKFEAVFVQTPVEQIGNSISFTGVILLITAIIIHRKERRSSAKTT